MVNHFNLAKVVLAEPNGAFRSEIEGVLKSMGFYDIMSTGNLGAAENALRDENIALFIGDTSLPEGDVKETVSNIRMSKLGENPFVVCLTMVSNPSKEKISAVVNSGVDDIAAKPFPASQMRDRIAMLAHTRPKFVVASDYIGPSRRDPSRDKVTDDLFAVPNPLASSLGLSNYIGALKIIKEHRIVRDGLKIREITEKVANDMASASSIKQILKDLEWLNRTADDLDGRLKDSVNKPVRAMIMTLRSLTDKIAKAGNLSEKDLEVLENLGYHIAGRFDKKRLAFSIDEYERKTEIKPETDTDIEKNFQATE